MVISREMKDAADRILKNRYVENPPPAWMARLQALIDDARFLATEVLKA